jgi:hypothetical protein
MRTRNLRFGLAVLGLLAALPGCETWKRSGLRRGDDPASHALSSIPDDEEDEPKRLAGLSNFFKPTRRSGALSSEGADIERSLGIP